SGSIAEAPAHQPSTARASPTASTRGARRPDPVDSEPLHSDLCPLMTSPPSSRSGGFYPPLQGLDIPIPAARLRPGGAQGRLELGLALVRERRLQNLAPRPLELLEHAIRGGLPDQDEQR